VLALVRVRRWRRAGAGACAALEACWRWCVCGAGGVLGLVRVRQAL
jgi:hypothetical protein